MTDKQQPEALRLAEMLTADVWPGSVTLVSYARECVAELRRLHTENETLRAGYDAAHLDGRMRAAQPAGAQQPAPSAAAAKQSAACDKAPAGWLCIHQHGHDGPCAAEPTLSARSDEWIEGYAAGVRDGRADALRAPQPSPTPQADSAKDEFIRREQWVERAMRVYLIAGDTEDEARECAEYQWGELDMDDIPDPYFTAMEDIEGRGPAPQADSVTAPAGGEINRLRAQVESLTRDCGRQASKIAELGSDLKFQEEKHREDRARLQALYEHQRGECWYWQGDGQDHLESLCNTLPVVIRADQLRALVSTPPAQAADSVLEDAERYRWLRQEHERVDPVCHLTWKRNLQRDSSEWVNTAVLDTAIDNARTNGDTP